MPESVFNSAFQSPRDGELGLGKKPVVFDITGANGVSILPEDLRMVLHVNPRSMQFSYENVIEVIQTRGGYVEQHWGQSPSSIAFEQATGGFVRLYTGVTAVTGPGPANSRLPASTQAINIGGTRRDTIAYDKYLDLLALYYNNGSVFDRNGNIYYQGKVKMTFDGGSYWGYIENLTVSDEVDQPYQFALSFGFKVERETHLLRSERSFPSSSVTVNG